MDVEEIVEWVTRSFGDESAVQITETDLIRWINGAQREIVMHNEAILQSVSEIDVSEGVNEYDFPDDLLVLRSARFKTSSMKSYAYIEPLSLHKFDRSIAGWDGDFQSEGVPRVYTTYERKIFLFPTPEEDSTGGLKILYSKRPTTITSTSDELSVPEEYHNAIIKFCMEQATTLDEDYEASVAHRTQFLGDIRALKHRDEEGSRETYPTITVMPDDA